MALQKQKVGLHNQMVGERIRHPPWTRFEGDVTPPVAKRFRRHDSMDSSLSRRESETDTQTVDSPMPWPREVPDSEDESDAEAPRASQTALESSLPSLKTNKEAIADYEASIAAERADVALLGERVGKGEWTRGKSSIYVDAFNLALETVLKDESHLFDAAESAVFAHWRSLSYESQYLYVVHRLPI